jgi:hypothetical protein
MAAYATHAPESGRSAYHPFQRHRRGRPQRMNEGPLTGQRRPKAAGPLSPRVYIEAAGPLRQASVRLQRQRLLALKDDRDGLLDAVGYKRAKLEHGSFSEALTSDCDSHPHPLEGGQDHGSGGEQIGQGPASCSRYDPVSP